MNTLTVAELRRRLQPGVSLTLIENAKGPCELSRTVVAANTVGAQFTGAGIEEGKRSYMDWPRAAQLQGTADGFEIHMAGRRLAYRWGQGTG